MKKYKVYEFNERGEKRLMIRATLARQAQRIVCELMKKFPARSYTIEIDRAECHQ